jgi:zinc transporter, ZIP family
VSSDLLAVLAAGSLAVLASACGPLPLALRRRVDKASLGSGTAIAAGVMLAVGGGLLLGSPDDAGLIVAGVAAGIVFVQVLRAALARRGDVDITDLAGRPDRHRAVLIVAVLTTHSAAEGIGLASAFAGSRAFGWTIGLALAVHRGVSVRVAAGFAALAALPLPLLAVPAFVFLDAFREILPAALGFAAGAMIFVVASEMLPEARRQVGGRAALIYCGTTFAATALFELAVSLA